MQRKSDIQKKKLDSIAEKIFAKDQDLQKSLEQSLKKSLEQVLQERLDQGMDEYLIPTFKEGFKQEFRKGYKHGYTESRAKTVKAFLQDGIEITKVSELTGLSEEEIKELLELL